MTEEQKKEEVVPQTFKEAANKMLAQYDGAPSMLDIENWKQQFGDVYISALSDDELFIFRCLRRKEYASLQNDVADGKMSPLEQEEATVKTCLLWTSVKDLSSKAGTIPTVLEQIVQNSNFMPPQLAAQFVAKL